MATTPGSGPWLRRNGPWLVVLPALVFLALAASSFRLTALYLPWSWSHPIVAHATTGVLAEDFAVSDGSRRHREVTVTVNSVLPVPSLDGDAAEPGGRLWRVELTFAAPPDQIVQGCEVLLVDAAGTRYRAGAANKVAADPGRPWSPATFVACVPADAPGPSDPLSLIPTPTTERPASWPVTAGVVLPGDAAPVGVIVRWQTPTFLRLDLPA